jgi:hypothetical protein
MITCLLANLNAVGGLLVLAAPRGIGLRSFYIFGLDKLFIAEIAEIALVISWLG